MSCVLFCSLLYNRMNLKLGRRELARKIEKGVRQDLSNLYCGGSCQHIIWTDHHVLLLQCFKLGILVFFGNELSLR